MSDRIQVLKWEKSQLGIAESPPGSNSVIYNRHYYGKDMRVSWCAVFQWDAFNQTGNSKLYFGGKKTASCSQLRDYYKAAGRIVAVPKEGDLVFYQFDKDAFADHVGMVSGIQSTKVFRAYEGNTSIGNDSNGGRVMERIRNINKVQCFARPQYQDQTQYNPSEFREELRWILKTDLNTDVNILWRKTYTVSVTQNRYSPVVTAIEKLLRYYGYYTGDVEAEYGKTPVFGPKCREGLKKYQKEIMKSSPRNCDGIASAKGLFFRYALLYEESQ